MNYFTNTGAGFVEAKDRTSAMQIFGDIPSYVQWELIRHLTDHGFCFIGNAVVADETFVEFDDLA